MVTLSDRQHWDDVYRGKAFDTVSWYAPHLEESLRLIERLCPNKAAAIIDIGGGESTLVDDLLARGYSDLSVLDISAAALDFTRQRLGSRASLVHWHVGDAARCDLGGKRFDLWHDRAVFHFLTDEADRRAYVDQVRQSVKPGGHVLMATFGPEGPTECSGLAVVRYDEQDLRAVFGSGFEALGSERVTHHTPSGADQQFLYCWCRRTP